MSYISDIFDRLEPQCICGFLLRGNKCSKIDNRPYIDRLEEAGTRLNDRLEEKFSGVVEYGGIMDEINSYGDIVEHVYMEIGMKCGAILAVKLLSEPTKE